MGNLTLKSKHRVICGDSTNPDHVARLVNGEQVDVCFTSPPYGLGDSFKLSGNKREKIYDSHEDSSAGWLDLMTNWFNASVPHISGGWLVNVQMLAGNKRHLVNWISHNVNRLADIITWDKQHAAPCPAIGVMSSQFEWIVVLSNDKSTRKVPCSSWRGTISNVYSAPGQRNNEYSEQHGATMPLHLPMFIFTSVCDQMRSVYEPFAGSGTTLVAAESLGRRAFCMEISPAYCDITVNRWEDLTGEKAVRVPGYLPGQHNG